MLFCSQRLKELHMQPAKAINETTKLRSIFYFSNAADKPFDPKKKL